MQNAPARTVFSVITDFLATNPTLQAIIAYQLPEVLQEQASYPAERDGEDELTAREREELQDFIRVEEMMSLLKAKMRVKLKRESESAT